MNAPEPSVVRVHAFITGLVQGVFYRNNTVKQAVARGLVGWVRNLHDGRVELVAEGPKPEVEDLLSWCLRGPARAKVHDIDVDWQTPQGGFPDFRQVADA
mmetsp:Transcript_55737/g.174574  ORF Transcript_55737/g.174574 Transcript_55737/m.174574 type:complete len:100 (-) Transcript_55737:100-399(-)